MSRLLACAFTIALVGFSPVMGRAADEPLNVLFLFSDDLRPELSGYGHPVVKTPNLDALASAGVRFERAYCQYPLCNPSRTSLLTGRYPSTTRVLDNLIHFRAVDPTIVTLPQFFKARGYTTYRAGKIYHGGLDDPEAWTKGGEPNARDAVAASPKPVGPWPASVPVRKVAPETPKKTSEGAAKKPNPKATAKKKPSTEERQRMSDRFVVLDGDGESHADHRTGDLAIDYLRKHKDGPFFLACGFLKPHSPPTAPKKWFDAYETGQVTLPVDFAPRPTVPSGFPPSCLVPNYDLFINRDASPEQAREMIRAYWASLTWVDWNVGRVLAELDRLGLRDRTVIVFWGDHGYHLGEKGKWAKHDSLFETGARVPLIIAAPGMKGNGRPSPRIVETLDIYPTLVDLCRLPRPDGIEGRSLRPLLDDPDADWDHPAFTMTKTGRAIRTDRWRYAEWGPDGQDGSMLIDEVHDPREMRNLADEPGLKSVRDALSAQLKQLDRPDPMARRPKD
jgi:arylsulfatase A-like enzyme